jgi:hypothetical protein
MAKKNFKDSPKPPKAPTLAELETCVATGPGHDQQQAPATTAPVSATQAEVAPTCRVGAPVPKKPYKRYQAVLNLNGIDMGQDLSDYMEKRTAELVSAAVTELTAQ